MKNKVFHFKQFSVAQDACAMKVCTDACLFGALISLSDTTLDVLDIGTGTGLLSLMLAQKFPNISIRAVEIDPQASDQAKQNFGNSAFSDRIIGETISIQEFAKKCAKKFDAIICNPPFFVDHLTPENPQKKVAKHTILLPPDELFEAVNALLHVKGAFWVLIPESMGFAYAELVKTRGFYISEKYVVRNFEHKPIARIILKITRYENKLSHTEVLQKDIVVYSGIQKYTENFKELLRPYYLNL